MRVFFAVLVLIFSVQSWTNANETGAFEIEGIVLKQSLLNYFDIKEIETKKKKGFIYSNKDFYSATFRSPKFNKYQQIQFHLKANDKEYLIYSISGNILYKNNISECYQEMEAIAANIKLMFENPKVKDFGIRDHSSYKNSKVKTILIDLYTKNFVESAILIECYDWSKEMEEKGHIDKLAISIDSKEFDDWINNEAYN